MRSIKARICSFAIVSLMYFDAISFRFIRHRRVQGKQVTIVKACLWGGIHQRLEDVLRALAFDGPGQNTTRVTVNQRHDVDFVFFLPTKFLPYGLQQLHRMGTSANFWQLDHRTRWSYFLRYNLQPALQSRQHTAVYNDAGPGHKGCVITCQKQDDSGNFGRGCYTAQRV